MDDVTLGVSNSTVATLQGGVIAGKAAGVVSVLVANPLGGGHLGQTNLQVYGQALDQRATVIGLDAIAVRQADFSLALLDSVVNRLVDGQGVVTVKHNPLLTFEGERASLAVSAVFDDSNRMSIGLTMVLCLRAYRRGLCLLMEEMS